MNFEGKVIGLLFAMPWFILSAGAATNYVTPAGAGSANGTDWDNAYSVAQLQTAVDACSTAGDLICLRYGVYSNSAEISAVSRPGLTIRGGYEGVGSPGGFTNDPTVLTRALSVTNRIFYGESSTLTLDRLWVTNGLGNTNFGGGLYLTNCNTLVTNCVITRNSFPSTLGIVKGGGIYSITGTLVVANSAVRNNVLSGNVNEWGGGIYAENAAVTLSGVAVVSNSITCINPDYGVGVWLAGGSARITGCTFENNINDMTWHIYGVGLGADSVNPLTISNCTFRGNNSAGTSVSYASGGALYMAGNSVFDISDCVFSGNFLAGNMTGAYLTGKRGSVMYLTGSGLIGTVSGCSMTGFTNGIALEMIYADIAATKRVTFRNTTIRGGAEGRGIYKMGTGLLTLTNCLVYSCASHAVQAEAGTVTVANSTLADNVGWGVTNNLAVVNVFDSVIWGNFAGGVRSTNGSVAYTCSQETLAGASNMVANPLWIAGYYLSAVGLPAQSVDSPCVNAGSKTALAAGLDTRTTRTDGSGDADMVDLGYHATNGVASSLSNLVLYVNATTGSDTNDGWTAGSPLKTITAAMGRTIDGSTLYVATGRYTWASGEVFPLASRMRNLTVKGANRDTTLLDATLTNGVFRGDGQGRIWLEGLTLANGNASAGAGVYLPGCRTVITNCTIAGNRMTVYALVYGCGIHATLGTLDVLDSAIRGNFPAVQMSYVYGGSIYAANAAVTLRNVTGDAYSLNVNNGVYGSGLFLSGGSALISDCGFNTNTVTGCWEAKGGAIYASGVNPLSISNCAFRGNTISSGYLLYGGALWINDCYPLTVSRCVFAGNKIAATSSSAEGGTMMLSGAALGGILSDCDITGMASGVTPETLSIETAGAKGMAIWNTAMKGAVGMGINKKGTGSLALTNCLIHSFTNNGILVTNGAVELANATLANNGGWGVSNATGAVTGRNCIAWGNTKGGFTNCSVTYTCSQEAQAGDGNKNMDPLFEGAVTNNFRLLRASPCVNTGLNEDWMIDARDLDGNARIIGKVVDMGAYEMTSPPVSGAMIIVK